VSVNLRTSKKNEISSGRYTNERIIHIKGIKEVKKGYLVKEVFPIVGMYDQDIFFKCVCPNALDCPLLGLDHDISNLSSSPLGNQSGFTVMSHSKVNLSQNVSLQKIIL
jgi:hypothetical protein